jgi:hypothetical protein
MHLQIFFPLSLLVFQPNDHMLKQIETFELNHQWGGVATSSKAEHTTTPAG